MGYYASDGLPNWYYEFKRDRFKMLELKTEVIDYVKEYGYKSASEVCEDLDINPLLEDEVEIFLSNWLEQEKERKTY